MAVPLNLQKLNAVAEAIGAASGSQSNPEALSVIAQKLTGTGTSYGRNIDALNAIAGHYIGAAQSHRMNIHAANAIAAKLGSGASYTMLADALDYWASHVSDSDAAIHLARISADSGHSADDSFLSQFIGALKAGSGGSGDCYALCDAIWLPGYCKKDGANKVSKLYDIAKAKPGFGAGGYYDATQSTASLQQTLTRSDNKGNLFRPSGNLTLGATVAAINVTTASDAMVAPEGIAWKITETTGTGFHVISVEHRSFMASGNVVVSWYVTAAGRTACIFRYFDGSATRTAVYNLTTLTVSGVSTGLDSGTITDVGNGWRKCSIRITATYAASTTTQIGMGPSDGTASYTGDGVSAVLVAAPSVRYETWDPDYIPTTTAPIYAGLDGKPVIQFDAGLGGYTTGTIETKTQPSTLFAISRKDGGGTAVRFVFNTSSVSDQMGFYYNNNTTSVGVYAGTGFLPTTTQETWGQFTALFNGVSSTARRKGVQIAAGNAGAQGTTGAFRIGHTTGGTTPHNGPIAAVISVRQVLTTAQRDHIENVLNSFFPSTV